MTSAARHKFTAGPCRPGEVRFAGKYQLVLDERSLGYVCEVAAPLLNGEFDETAREARVSLIAEAFTVAHETGLTPRQLAEQRDELLASLRSIEAALRKDSRDKTVFSETVEYHLDGQAMFAAINQARAAIAKATAGGAV